MLSPTNEGANRFTAAGHQPRWPEDALAPWIFARTAFWLPHDLPSLTTYHHTCGDRLRQQVGAFKQDAVIKNVVGLRDVFGAFRELYKHIRARQSL